MINNFFFLLKIIRIFKAYDILRLIGRNVRYRIIYTIITQLLSIGVSKNKELINDSSRAARLADPDRGINSPAFKKFMADRGMQTRKINML